MNIAIKFSGPCLNYILECVFRKLFQQFDFILPVVRLSSYISATLQRLGQNKTFFVKGNIDGKTCIHDCLTACRHARTIRSIRAFSKFHLIIVNSQINDTWHTYGPNSVGREKCLKCLKLTCTPRVAQPKRLVQETCPFSILIIYGLRVSDRIFTLPGPS